MKLSFLFSFIITFVLFALFRISTGISSDYGVTGIFDTPTARRPDGTFSSTISKVTKVYPNTIKQEWLICII